MVLRVRALAGSACRDGGEQERLVSAVLREKMAQGSRTESRIPLKRPAQRRGLRGLRLHGTDVFVPFTGPDDGPGAA
ncbi:hypothetical protein KJ742_04505 [Patescibacteria group bacterium]|nr:hypothetical protein [Patescibacteria group bacterium]MBU1683180.1 hypothetical protein [Patescibacteria group bacterium]MBU1934738.1 hypothetical protein [Patescibacteria group bacterium]